MYKLLALFHLLVVVIIPLTLAHQIQPRLDLKLIIQLELLNALLALRLGPYQPNRRILHRQLLVLRQALPQRLEAMLHQFFPRTIGKVVNVSLEVRSRHLAAGANGKRHHLLRHARGLEIKQVRACLVDAGNQQADTVGALAVHLGVDLGLFANHVDECADGHGAAVRQSVAQALLLHEVGEDAGVGSQTGDGDADVFVNVEEFLVVRGEFFGVALVLLKAVANGA